MTFIKSLYFLVLIKISRIVDYFWTKYWTNSPITNRPLADKSVYQALAEKAANDKFEEIDDFEKKCGYSVDRKWIDELAFYTQIVKKKSPLCYAHGRVLYAAVSNWLTINRYSHVNVIETGTARGFSSLCIAKALNDFGVSGSIVTFDLLPSKNPIYWNCINDNDSKLTRFDLLKKWRDLLDKYIIFIQGDTKVMLPKVGINRVHLAYLDGSHTYKDVMFEFKQICNFQEVGDMIIFDDYSKSKFPGLVVAVDEICNYWGYSRLILTASNDRNYVIATKKT